MADNPEKDQDRLGDNWLGNWEDQCIEGWDTESNMEERTQNEIQQWSQKVWLSFQNSASSISQLYKEGSQPSHQDCHGARLWVPFQNSASSATRLFKDSQDSSKKSLDIGTRYGQYKRTKDILAWVRKRRRHIRKEELIAFLCGKNPPVRHHKPSGSLGKSSMASRVPVDRVMPFVTPRLPAVAEVVEDRGEPDLQPFKDALALQGLSGAMSNISMGLDPQGLDSTNQCTATNGSREDIHGFILDELSRRCDTNSRKRTASNDVIMDSPTRKRGRLL